jgi:NAD(P)H-nitrite reductase large subunit
MRHVIIGSSAAGVAAAAEIRRHDAAAAITIVSREETIYSRCQLHWIAAGVRTPRQAQFLPPDWAAGMGVEMLAPQEARAIDVAAGAVVLDSGQRVPYDRLLIATGARTGWPPIEGLKGEGVLGLRDLGDAVALRTAVAGARKVAVVGAGLVGCELAASLAEAHKPVALVELAAHPLPLQLDEETGELCAQLLRGHGVQLHCSQSVERIVRDDRGKVRAVALKSGIVIEADLVVMAAGVRANKEIAESAGIVCGRGIRIDERCHTNVGNIYAAGDVTESPDTLVGQVMPSAIWPTAVRQGRVAGANMAGGADSLARNTGLRASISLLGMSIVSLGPLWKIDPAWRKMTYRSTNSAGRPCLRTLYFQADVLRCAILWGDVVNAGVYTEAILKQRPLGEAVAYAGDLDAAKRGLQEATIFK